MVCIAIVAGEASGDVLGAALLNTLQQRFPHAEFIGIGGPEMIRLGFKSLYSIERLSVMGLFEVLKHLPSLLKMRKRLFQQLLDKKPDIFVGIDAPDFNLGLERKLKEAGVTTVHYVSPSVWAWRQWRVKKIAASIDLMLTLFPFEVEFYRDNNIPAKFVGHPLASAIPVKTDMQVARSELGLSKDSVVMALLPGSRRSEVKKLSKLFIQVAIECYKNNHELEFIAPFATKATQEIFQAEIDTCGVILPVTLLSGQSRLAMQSSDCILLASGTAALEAMLLKKPMVVTYIMNGFTFWILKKFKILKSSLYSLPNVLSGSMLVKEYIQNDATKDNIVNAMTELLESLGENPSLSIQYNALHGSLIQEERYQAGNVIADLIEKQSR